MIGQTAIIGATTWGTTLGILLAQNGVPVSLLTRSESEAQTLTSQGRNARFLPDAPFPDSLSVTSEPESALRQSSLVIIAVPSDRMRVNVQRIKSHLQLSLIHI